MGCLLPLPSQPWHAPGSFSKPGPLQIAAWSSALHTVARVGNRKETHSGWNGKNLAFIISFLLCSCFAWAWDERHLRRPCHWRASELSLVPLTPSIAPWDFQSYLIKGKTNTAFVSCLSQTDKFLNVFQPTSVFSAFKSREAFVYIVSYTLKERVKSVFLK